MLASVLAMASADTATVGASATNLRADLHISNAGVGLLVAVTSLIGAIGAVPYGLLADRVNRVWTLTLSVTFWGVAMVGSATAGSFSTLVLWRVALGLVTAAAGPPVASLVGDYFPSSERGVIYSYILSGELLGAGIGFTITGDISALSWRAAFVILGLAGFPLAWALSHLPEPARGGANPMVAVTPGTEPAPSRPPNPPLYTEDGRPVPPPAPPPEPDAQTTDAQRLAAEAGILPDEAVLAQARRRGKGIVHTTRFVLSVRTNVALILSSALGYYFLAGVQTFGVEFVRGRYHVGVPLANLLMIAIGAGALVGVVTAGPLSDSLLHRGHIKARVQVPAVAAALTVLLFIPALLTHSVLTALPYVILAAVALSAQNPPIDAARLDIMPFQFWGRAEGIRTLLRTLAQSLAPVLFGALSDAIGLRNTFMIMLLPLAAGAVFLFRATRTYPTDVATAVAVTEMLPRP
jgi:MFS family permease